MVRPARRIAISIVLAWMERNVQTMTGILPRTGLLSALELIDPVTTVTQFSDAGMSL
jgi:hypothetical protein